MIPIQSPLDDLLIAPYRGHPAGLVATKIDSDLDQETNHNAEIAFLQGLIVARLASITDPGNADGVITVGATHRFWPHTYGVSFFSSRGPTGDGRLKPDLVAPGEKIRSVFVPLW